MTDESLHVLLAGDVPSPCAPSAGHASPLPAMHSPFPHKHTQVSRRRKQASRFRCCFLPMHAARRTNLSIMLLAGNVFSPCTPHGGRMRSPSPAMHSPFPRIRTRVSRFKKQASRFLSCFLPARLPADESLMLLAGNVFSPCAPSGGRMRSPLPAMHSPFPRIRTRVSRFKKQASRFLSCFLPARLPADESLMLLAGNVFSPCAPSGGRMRSPSPAMHSPFPRKRTRVS